MGMTALLCARLGGAAGRGYPNRSRIRSWVASFGTSSAASTGQDTAPLVELQGATLGYPTASSSSASAVSAAWTTAPVDYTVNHPTEGGHVLVGRNGSGKTLLTQALVTSDEYLIEGNIFREDETHQEGRMRKPPMVAHVSFQSHEALLKEGGSVSKAILGFEGGVLTPAARFLAVRFGLFPFLARDVRTLSTGEIRKVLLVRALAQRPRLLILDHAFDGLDVASRKNLQTLVSKTLRGFRPDILVQGVDAKSTAHTQIVLLTHRPEEEMVDEMETISYFRPDGTLETILRQGRTGKEIHDLLQTVMTSEEEDAGGLDDLATSDESWWHDPTLPSVEEVAAWWNLDRNCDPVGQGGTIVQAENLSIQKGDATILHELNWSMTTDQRRWLIAGGNGQGKSTLSRLIAKHEDDVIKEGGSLSVFSLPDDDEHATNHLSADNRPGVSWFSTELHMSLARSNLTAREIFCGGDEMTPSAFSVAKWLFIDNESLLSRPFSQLSQGEQKLTLIAAALAARSPLLVLDEPSQALDQVHRRRLLALVERICQATDMNLVYVTHHMDEVLPSVTHVLHLKDGRDVYQGIRDDYDPNNL